MLSNTPSTSQERLILGIDPGTLFMGYALLRTKGKQAKPVLFDVLDVHKMDDQYARLQKEFFFIQDLIDTYHPTVLAIESQFVDKNPQTMIKIVHAQGVAIAAALSKDLPVVEYSPLKIKMAITGNGHSSKEQVAGMLNRFLNLGFTLAGKKIITPNEKDKVLDATDALAIAYCHFLQAGLPVHEHGARDWTTFAKQRGLTQNNLTTPAQALLAAVVRKK